MATGIHDPFPAIPGIGECLGASIYLCPDCDGYETVDQNTAVIGGLPQALELVEDSVEQLLHAKGKLQGLLLASGEQLDVTRAFLSFPGAKPQTGLLRSFSVRFNEKGHVLTNPRTMETDHPNVWAVGDIVEHSQQVASAMGDGAQAAIWIQKRLRDQDQTLAERR